MELWPDQSHIHVQSYQTCIDIYMGLCPIGLACSYPLLPAWGNYHSGQEVGASKPDYECTYLYVLMVAVNCPVCMYMQWHFMYVMHVVGNPAHCISAVSCSIYIMYVNPYVMLWDWVGIQLYRTWCFNYLNMNGYMHSNVRLLIQCKFIRTYIHM